MKEYKRKFIELALRRNVLRFGTFTLKSGRVSPYFFNAGLFCTGADLGALGEYYADALEDSGAEFDVLFGPAYKGIPLVAAAAIARARKYGRETPWAFNRKEAKDHGEGGALVGAPLAGRVALIDDVMTAGTAVRESARLIAARPDARLAAVIIALDREERGTGELGAVQETERDYGVPVYSIVTLSDLAGYMRDEAGLGEQLARLEEYREKYGVKRSA